MSRHESRPGLCASLSLAAVMTACAHAAGVLDMTPTVDPAAYRPTNRSIRVADITGGRQTQALGRSHVGNDEFRVALVRTLVASGLFRTVETDSGSNYVLGAEILNQEASQGLTMRASLFVHYSVRDQVSGEEVFSQSVLSRAEAGVRDAMIGSTRYRIVKERAVQNNLTQLLQMLSDSLPHTR